VGASQERRGRFGLVTGVGRSLGKTVAPLSRRWGKSKDEKNRQRGNKGEEPNCFNRNRGETRESGTTALEKRKPHLLGKKQSGGEPKERTAGPKEDEENEHVRSTTKTLPA